MNDIQWELQRILDLTVSFIFDGFARVASPVVVLSNDGTAFTNGRAFVNLLTIFEDRPLAQHLNIAIGLMAHELGHWLQPLKEIEKVEKETGLDHDIVNLLLDIQLEESVPYIAPLFAHNLRDVRALVKSRRRHEYFDGLKNSKGDRLTTSIYLLLIGRFCSGDMEMAIHSFVRPPQGVMDDYGLRLSVRAEKFMATLDPRNLPSLLRSVARDFPELCHKDGRGGNGENGGEQTGGIKNPTNAVFSGGINEISILMNGALDAYQDHVGIPFENHFTISKIMNAPEPVKAESRRIAKRWEVPRSAGTVMGPGRMNRLAAVRGEPVPFDIESPKGRRSKMKIFLVADKSSSMKESERWSRTREAAMAITFAVRNSGGEICGAIFDTALHHTEDFSADIFFAQNAMPSGGTSFGWLSLVWQKFPDYRVVVLTDGDGSSPMVVPKGSRKRTSAILLLVNDSAELQKVTTIVSRFAEKIVRVSHLHELTSAWAAVIPRQAS